jgi:two-component system chemotaxis response regulator CheB
LDVKTPEKQLIRVLIVDDSSFARDFLNYILSSDDEIEVIGMASGGEEALSFAQAKKPDVITMDLHMPFLNGIETTKMIMEQNPTPIVIVSSVWNPQDAEMGFLALQAGALAIVQRPIGIGQQKYEKETKELIKTVKLISETKVVRQRERQQQIKAGDLSYPVPNTKDVSSISEIKAVAIGASTGGPVVIQKILAGLYGFITVPILIVQHMSSGFAEGFAGWLCGSTGFPVQVPMNGEYIFPGIVYVAPDSLQMGVTRDHRILLSDDASEYDAKPSVSFLFRSVAEAYGSNAVGILLTGAGRDGVKELKVLREAGAVTIAQDEDTSAVYGMPGEAVKIKAATHVLPAGKIAYALISLIGRDISSRLRD